MFDMLTVTEAARRVGRSPATVYRWIRDGRLVVANSDGRRMVNPVDLENVRDEMYPMLHLPEEWGVLDDGSIARNWAAAVALSRSGR